MNCLSNPAPEQSVYAAVVSLRGTELKYVAAFDASSQVEAEQKSEVLASRIGVSESERKLIDTRLLGAGNTFEQRRRITQWLNSRQADGCVLVRPWMMQTKIEEVA